MKELFAMFMTIFCYGMAGILIKLGIEITKIWWKL